MDWKALKRSTAQYCTVQRAFKNVKYKTYINYTKHIENKINYKGEIARNTNIQQNCFVKNCV